MEIIKETKESLGSNEVVTSYVIKALDGSLCLSELEFCDLVRIATTHTKELPEDVIAHIRDRKKIDAIKLLRVRRSGLGLHDAKDAVEKWAADNGVEWSNNRQTVLGQWLENMNY